MTRTPGTSRNARLFKALLLAGTFLLSGISVYSPSPSALPGSESTGAYPFEVRLRKMHLVRPDLIPYPIHTDFYA
jgi:hypothetical protein